MMLGSLWSLVLGHSSFSPTFAQTTPPSDLKFICGPANGSTKTAPCTLQVPADLIGASFEIEIPKSGKISQIQNLKKGNAVPNSGLFFRLEIPSQGDGYLLQVDYADIQAQAPGTSPYALLQFDVVLVSATSSDFPVVIQTLMKVGGQLYTPASLADNEASFAVENSDAPLELRILGLQEGDSASSINSSFRFAAGSDGGTSQNIPKAPDFYCFDDPIDSMTDAEWIIICDAKRRGIVSGNPREGGIFFFPNQPINRAEAVKIVTLGILRSLGKLTDADFSAEEQKIRDAFPQKRFITYPDIEYEAEGVPPWFAVYVNIAGEYKIAEGYPHDGTFKAVNKINNAESYRVIVETGRVASDIIGRVLEVATRRAGLRTEDWFLKYANTLDEYNIEFSKDYAKFTTRKEFLIIVMDLLAAVGL